MKRNLEKIGLFLVLGLAIAVFYSCDKNDDYDNGGGSTSTIIVTNVINGSTQITTVKALVYWESGDSDGNDAIAQTQYKNNGFTLELPSTVAAKYLELVYEDAPQSISISDKNAKVSFINEIEGYDKDENGIGYFYLDEEKGDNEYYDISWLYADRDVTIKGEVKEIDDDYDYEEIGQYDLKLKKGWNVTYNSYIKSYNNSTKRDVYTYSITSQKPSNINYVWNFERNFDFRSAQATTESIENTKSIFSKLKENKKTK